VAEETKQSRRVIRKAETMREQVEKSATDQPRRLGGVRRVAGAPFRASGRGLAVAGRKANAVKPLRILGFIIVPPYFRNSWRELRQVTWPTGRESRQLTLAVVIFAIVFGVMIAIVDYGLDKLFKQVLLK